MIEPRRVRGSGNIAMLVISFESHRFNLKPANCATSNSKCRPTKIIEKFILSHAILEKCNAIQLFCVIFV